MGGGAVGSGVGGEMPGGDDCDEGWGRGLGGGAEGVSGGRLVKWG